MATSEPSSVWTWPPPWRALGREVSFTDSVFGQMGSVDVARG